MKNRRFAHAAVTAVCSLFILVAYAGPKDFWETKPYTEWTAKEVEKILLKDSPWSHVLLLNAPSSSVSIGSTSSGGGASGPPPIYINWYARPIREAIVRQMMLMAPDASKEQLAAILAHKTPFHDLIITGFVPGGGSRGGMRGAAGGGRGARGATGGGRGDVEGGLGDAGNTDSAMAKFKEDTYLQKKNGDKIPLANLVPPPPRSKNAPYHIQFAKEIDGKPTLTVDDKEVTLVIRINESVYKYKFKFADMTIKGNLEL